MYIAIDGDDSGRRVAACFLRNNEEQLSAVSQQLKQAAERISNLLASRGFKVIFCAADGVTAMSTEAEVDYHLLFDSIQELSSSGMTFSAGVGASLQEAYIALLDAKSLGKDRLSIFAEINI